MSEMEEKLGSILANPQLMQQIMNMAQALNAAPPEQNSPPPQRDPAPTMPDFDPGMIQKLSSLFRQSGADQNQQSLLRALSPYVSREKLYKLEKAMRSAKMAQMASIFLNSGGAQMLSGR